MCLRTRDVFACYCPFRIGLHSQYFKYTRNRERPMQFQCCTLTTHTIINWLCANNHWLGLLSFKWDCLFAFVCSLIVALWYYLSSLSISADLTQLKISVSQIQVSKWFVHTNRKKSVLNSLNLFSFKWKHLEVKFICEIWDRRDRQIKRAKERESVVNYNHTKIHM